MNDTQFEHLLHQALQPDIEPAELIVYGRFSRKGTQMTMKHLMKKALIAAAAVLLLTTTVFAADSLNIRTLISGGSFKVYETVQQAEMKAGFEIDDRETFSNGYTVTDIRVDETKGLDKDDRVRLTYNEIRMQLQREDGQELTLTAYQQQKTLPDSERSPDQTRRIGDIIVSYRVDHYRFVPADYELTGEDKTWMNQPGNFLSYGSEKVEETDVAFLTWENQGICYILLDQKADEPADSLFSMAEDLIHSGT